MADCADANDDTLGGSFEGSGGASRAPEVAKWQQKWKASKYQPEEEDSGSSGPGLGPGEGFRASQPPCGVGLGDALQLPKEDIAGAIRVLRASEASAVGRMRGGAAPDRDGHLSRAKVELLAPAHCAAGRTERGYKNLPAAEVEGL